MDRLFDGLPNRQDQALLELAEVELKLEAHRRVRRVMTAGALATSALCWADARVAFSPLRLAPPLFALFALSALTIRLWERPLTRRHRRMLVVAAPANDDGHQDERQHLRDLRRALAGAAATLGVLPFAHAVDPAFLPSLVAGLSAGWTATLCALAAVTVQELLLTRRAGRTGDRARG